MILENNHAYYDRRLSPRMLKPTINTRLLNDENKDLSNRMKGSKSNHNGVKASNKSEQNKLSKPSRFGSDEVEDPVSTMRYNILTGNKKLVMKVLKEINFLNNIVLEPLPQRRLQKAEKEAVLDKITVNGVNFFGGSKSHNGLALLYDLCRCFSPDEKDEMYNQIVVNMSRLTANMDFFLVKNPIDLSPLTLKKFEQSMIASPPISVELFFACDCVHVNISTPITHGLYRQNELDELERQKTTYSKKTANVTPWIMLSSVIEAKINLTTGAQTRILKTQLL